jgi:two-component system, NarL family, response regulator LiaR
MSIELMTEGKAKPARTPPDERVRAIVADDDPLARRMIKEALQRAGILVVAEAQNGREAVELCRYYTPDIMLMDVVMPGVDGIAATREILGTHPDQIVVILTSSDDDDMGVLGLRAGAAGFLSKDTDVDALPKALLGAAQGEAAISRRLAMRLVETVWRIPDATTGMRPVKSPLTAREWEVVDLLSEGKTTDEIAETLVLSRETVRSHVKNLLRKLDARSRGEAVAVAERMRASGGRGPTG